MEYDVVIVGAGHGGAQVASTLRQLKYAGSIAVIGDEPEYPYERPPLSKEYFAGDKDFARILIRPPEFWAERDIDMHLGQRISSVDPAKKSVTTSDDQTIGYGKLVWATGGQPRTLPIPGGDLPNVFCVRTKSDADAMIAAAASGTRVAVIGGGYIGLEAAAVLNKAGLQVTVLEAAPRVLSRVAGPAISTYFEQQHRAHGVDVRLDQKVRGIVGIDQASSVSLEGGEDLPVDFIVVGIGIDPSTLPLTKAGANGINGVDVDEHCATSLPDVYAIGDCAAHFNKYADGAFVRLESVQNANDMGRTVARHLIGKPVPYDTVPWFWSNQYDIRLQTVGLSIGHDEEITRGDPQSGSFSVVYLQKSRVIALDCVNAPHDYVQGKRLISSRAMPDRALLANTDSPLSDLIET